MAKGRQRVRIAGINRAIESSLWRQSRASLAAGDDGQLPLPSLDLQTGPARKSLLRRTTLMTGDGGGHLRTQSHQTGRSAPMYSALPQHLRLRSRCSTLNRSLDNIWRDVQSLRSRMAGSADLPVLSDAARNQSFPLSL